MNSVTKKGYAKINLHLDVLKKYENGFHEVNTVMQTVSLSDEVTVSTTVGGITLSCTSPSVPCDETNIAYRAAALFLAETGEKLGVAIEIDKQIPIAAGLAGGSADAAATLLALNELCGEPLSCEQLFSLGANLGADVPFCMQGGTAFANGKGDVLHPFPEMPDCFIVVARGGEGASTPWAYRTLDEIYCDFSGGVYTPRDISALKSALEEKEIDKLGERLYNIFESAILPHRPIAVQIKESLISNGAVGAMMSGSGTAVFGIFKKENDAQAAAEKIKKYGHFAVVARPKK